MKMLRLVLLSMLLFQLVFIAQEGIAQLQFSDHMTYLGKFKKKRYWCLRKKDEATGFSKNKGMVVTINKMNPVEVNKLKTLIKKVKKRILVLKVAYGLTGKKSLKQKLNKTKAFLSFLKQCSAGTLPPSISITSFVGSGLSLSGQGHTWDMVSFHGALHDKKGKLFTTWLSAVDEAEDQWIIWIVGKLIDLTTGVRSYSCSATVSFPNAPISITNTCTVGVNTEVDGFVTFRIDISVLGIDMVFFITKSFDPVTVGTKGDFNKDGVVGLEVKPVLDKCYKASAKGKKLTSKCSQLDYNGDSVVNLQDLWNAEKNKQVFNLDRYFSFRK